MTNLTFFFDVLLKHFDLYILSIIISSIIYGYIAKKIVRSILDPLLFAMISCIFANSIPIFLVFVKEISLSTFIYIALSEAIFWGAYFFFRARRIEYSEFKYSLRKVEVMLFYASFCICVGCYLLTYALFGIPLFKVSRLETYQNANGLGILSYFQSFTQFYCIIYSYYLIHKKEKKLFSYSVLILILIFCLLSGSKSAILIFVSCYFFYLYYYRNKRFNLKKNLKYIIPLLIFPIAIITIQTGADFKGALLSLTMRFVANGDCYWMSLPNGVIDNVEINDPLQYLFSRILAPLRLLNYNNIDTPIGVQIYWDVYPSDYGITKGPNARLPILGWVLYKWGGLFISLIFGVLFAFWHTRLIRCFPRGIIFTIIYGYIYVSMTAMLTDPLYSTGFLFNFLLFGTFIYFCLIAFGGRNLKLVKKC